MRLSGRGAVINLGAAGPTVLFLVCLPSIGIGALCRAVAGATAHPVKGAIVGGIIAGLMFRLFVMPIVFLASMFGLAGKVEQFTFP